MVPGPALPTLLSQTLVAFTVELDNEFERRIAAAGAGRGFLVSFVMWSNFMRFVEEDGLSVRDLSARAGIAKGSVHPSLAGMERWGYVVVGRAAGDSRPKPPRADLIVRPTARGRTAREVWRPLPQLVEDRWRERFGADAVDRVRDAVAAVLGQLEVSLPRYLPVLGFGLLPAHFDAGAGAADAAVGDLDLPALLSKLLLAFALDFERESELPMAMSADVVGVLDEQGQRVRDLPRRSGVSKEATSIGLGFLDRRGYVVVEPHPTEARTKVARLTAKGRRAQEGDRQLLGAVEARWCERFGPDAVEAVRESLRAMTGTSGELSTSPLAAGLAPYPDGWRASVRAPDVLPHYPMVLHRGGWPDGS